MEFIFTLLFTVIFLFPSFGQLTVLTALEESIYETSGLIYLNEKLITHNDSGGQSALYELDSTTGIVTRTVAINNATNTDWEDLAHDDTYIYIGDFGNNIGSRIDLKVYRILIADYLINDEVNADVINFEYADQIDFTPTQFSTNFDAEALMAYNDQLYIFTKNWGDNQTNIYALSKMPGSYTISKVDSIDVQGLVTAATYNIQTESIVLTGYNSINPFVIEIKDFDLEEFSNGVLKKYNIQPSIGISTQIESIAVWNHNQYYLTAEQSIVGDSVLFRLEIETVLGVEHAKKSKDMIYPNPAADLVYVDCEDFLEARIYDLKGVLHKVSSDKEIIVSSLKRGIYVLLINKSIADAIVGYKLIVD